MIHRRRHKSYFSINPWCGAWMLSVTVRLVCTPPSSGVAFALQCHSLCYVQSPQGFAILFSILCMFFSDLLRYLVCFLRRKTTYILANPIHIAIASRCPSSNSAPIYGRGEKEEIGRWVMTTPNSKANAARRIFTWSPSYLRLLRCRGQ
ncbi:hypothetical protein N431DRAFT_178772 [Stipitochalara longipes BDJ]|nr:hypothetical protein N431DRAFT_178772 [Stipitochalara longipes BDJ]